MCLAEVGRITDVDGASAAVDVDGRARAVSLAALVLDGVAPRAGEWLLVHAGFAIEVLQPTEAAELAAFAREVRAAAKEET